MIEDSVLEKSDGVEVRDSIRMTGLEPKEPKESIIQSEKKTTEESSPGKQQPLP